MEGQSQDLGSGLAGNEGAGAPSNEGGAAPRPVVPGSSPSSFDDDPEDVRLVGELVAALVKAARAHQIYQSNSPVYRNFISGLHEVFGRILSEFGELTLLVDHEEFRWRKHAFASGEGRDSMAFLFYRDGVRTLTFRAGFENEVELFLETIKRARQVNREGDDILTLLWEAGFEALTYTYQDMLAAGVPLPEGAEPATTSVSPALVAAEVGAQPRAGEDGGAVDFAAAGGPALTPAGIINPDEFEETLYFLSRNELQVLREETREEWDRDLKGAVLSALFDRAEEPAFPERQTEIVGILGQFITLTLARGDLTSVARILRELNELLGRPDVLTPDQRAAAEGVFDQLSEPELIRQLVRSLEDEVITPGPEELALFLEHLRAPALPVLIAAAEGTEKEDLRQLLTSSVTRIARERTDDVVALLDSQDPAVSIGAARLAGRLGLGQAVPKLRSFLQHADPGVRLTAVEALVSLRSGPAVEALQTALTDVDREVRMKAVRGLASLQYRPAAAWLRPLLDDRGVRDADLTEKIGFFEAYAVLDGVEGIPVLDKILNTKSLLGRRPPPEVRACAARALGLIRSPGARSALERAEGDHDPVVRAAVARALRPEAPPEAPRAEASESR